MQWTGAIYCDIISDNREIAHSGRKPFGPSAAVCYFLTMRRRQSYGHCAKGSG
nr:MAG TPA: hypothetical protein [Caudoviricetes sp.]